MYPSTPPCNRTWFQRPSSRSFGSLLHLLVVVSIILLRSKREASPGGCIAKGQAVRLTHS